MQPGAVGLVDTVSKRYETATTKFLSQVPESLRPGFQAHFATEGARLQGAVQAQAQKEQQRYFGAKQDRIDATLLDDITRNHDDPKSQDFAEKQLYAFNRTAPLSPIDKDNRLQSLPDKIAVAKGLAVVGDRDRVNGVLNPPQAGDTFSRMLGVENAPGDPSAVSSKGALGLAQVMPDTAREMAKETGVPGLANLNDAQLRAYFATPEGAKVNVQLGKAYFDKQLRTFGGDQEAATIAYNGGPGVAADWLRKGRDDAVLPAETRAYRNKVFGGPVGPGAGASADLQVGQDVGVGPEENPDGSPVKTPFVNAQGKAYDTAVTVKPGEDMSRLSPGARGMVSGILAAGVVPELRINAGFETSGHAEHSQHYRGNAVDIQVSGLTDEQKAALISTAIANGAKGIGIYPSGRMIHIDTRQNPTFWGPNPAGMNKGASLDMAPAWARPALATLFKGGGGAARAVTPADFPDGGFSRYQQFFRQQSPDASPAVINNLATEAVKSFHSFSQADKQEQATVQNLIQTDHASIRQTGQDVSDLTPERVTAAFGPEAGDAFVESRTAAHQFFAQTGDFAALPESEIQTRLEQLRPQPGSARYLDQQQDFSSAQAMANRVISNRIKDPAGAVESFPAVRAAAQTADIGKPDTMFSLIQARMAAQTALGIPAQQQSPMSAREAQAFAAPLQHALPGQERQAIKDTIEAIDATYGDHAQRALEFMLDNAKVDKETQKVAASVLRRIGLGQPVTQQDGAALDDAQQADAVTKAAAPLASVADPRTSGNPATVPPGVTLPPGRFPRPNERQPKAAPPGKPVPDQGAIDMLLQNPGTANHFDAAYQQPGLAQKILEASKAGKSRLTPQQLTEAAKNWQAQQARDRGTPQGAFQAGVFKALTPTAPAPRQPPASQADVTRAVNTGIANALRPGDGPANIKSVLKKFGLMPEDPDIPKGK